MSIAFAILTVAIDVVFSCFLLAFIKQMGNSKTLENYIELWQIVENTRGIDLRILPLASNWTPDSKDKPCCLCFSEFEWHTIVNSFVPPPLQ